MVSNAELVLKGIYQKNIDSEIECNLKDIAGKIYCSKINNVIFKDKVLILKLTTLETKFQ